MLSMTKLALAATLVLGAASGVQAANENDGGNETGGFRVGPLGQKFQGANPAYHRSMRYEHGVYAYVPGYPSRHYRTWGWDWDRN
jgi:hypothetical protein